MPEIFSIGHSNHAIGHFLALLRQHEIAALADVRSRPYSRFNPQFNRESLAGSLRSAGISYVFLGEELGGKRDGVTYAEIAASDGFRRGLERLREGAAKLRIVFMCAERQPLDCHRTLLVSRHLKAPDLVIRHILADGMVEEHTSVERRLVEKMDQGPPPLIASDPQTWRAAVERAYAAATE